MENTVLLQILSTFSDEEFKDFGRLVNSPFFNRNKKLTGLYNFLKRYHPEFKPEKLKPEIIYKKLYDSGKYSPATIRYLFSEMKVLAETYLNFSFIKKREPLKLKLGYLQELDKRRLDNIFKNEFKKIYGDDYSAEKFSYNVLQEKLELEAVQDVYEAKRIGGLHNKYILNYDYTKKIKTLVEYFAYSALSEHEYFISLYINYGIKYDFESFISIENLIKSNEFVLANPLIKMKYLMVLLLMEKKDEYFHEIKKTLFENIKKIEVPDIYNAVTYLKNHCAGKVSEGDRSFVKERFNLLKFQIEHNALVYGENEYLSIQTFKAAIDTATDLKEFEWAENFIKNQNRLIRPSDRENCVNYANALLHFSRKNYDEATLCLSKIPNVSHTYYKISVKRLSLKICWEKQMYDTCYDMIGLYRKFLAYDKTLPENIKESHSAFLKYFKQLLKIELDRNSAKLKELINEITNGVKIPEREWLLEKTIELEAVLK